MGFQGARSQLYKFNFQIDIPQSWTIQPNPVKAYMLGDQTAVDENADDEIKGNLNSAKLGAYNVLFATKYPEPDKEKSNSVIDIMIERLEGTGVETLEMYLDSIEYGLVESGIDFNLLDKQVSRDEENQIGIVAVEIVEGDKSLVQNYSVIWYGDFTVTFITVVGEEKDLEEVATILETLNVLEK